MKSIIAIAFLFLISIAVIVNADDSICIQFHQKLSELPYDQLNLNTKEFVSLFDGKPLDGCEVVFQTNELIVSGDKVHDLYNELINSDGWTKNHDYAADGPGSSLIGIENDGYRCLINWSQHSWLDDKTNEIRQSDKIRMVVQCSLK